MSTFDENFQKALAAVSPATPRKQKQPKIDIATDPNIPRIYVEESDFATVTNLRRGPHGTTVAKVDGETVYFYRRDELRRDEGTTAGFYGAWKSNVIWSDSLARLVKEIDERKARKAAERAAKAGG